MKRLAVCLTAGILLATSTAAFATPITGTWTWTAPGYDNTVSSGFNRTQDSSYNTTIKWSQPYANATAPTLPSMADLGLDPAGTLTWDAPDITINSASLTLVASGVNVGGTYAVYRGPGATNQIGTLNESPGSFHTGDGTTAITLLDANAWLAPTGFNPQTGAPGNDQDVYVKSSELKASSHWDYDWSYEPPPPVVIPAPGAILLASLGAGLVSWLRVRKVL